MSRYSSFNGGWPTYVTVAERKEQAAKMVKSLRKKGQKINPIVIEGRAIAKTFWGKAWCKNLASYSDFENRLPRGRTYARNGSVIDLSITEGEIKALVSGSSIYQVTITITAVASAKWHILVEECAGRIDSLIELLQGKFSKAVMEIITNGQIGLFPSPKEIKMSCSCPDSAFMCKHIAAALYGVGARLDEKPEKLFVLRSRDHTDLISIAGALPLSRDSKDKKGKTDKQTQEVTEDLTSLFGIDIEIKPEIPDSTQKKIRKNKT